MCVCARKFFFFGSCFETNLKTLRYSVGSLSIVAAGGFVCFCIFRYPVGYLCEWIWRCEQAQLGYMSATRTAHTPPNFKHSMNSFGAVACVSFCPNCCLIYSIWANLFTIQKRTPISLDRLSFFHFVLLCCCRTPALATRLSCKLFHGRH